ncbi:MAG: MOSC domain-containing protein [bacterium]
MAVLTSLNLASGELTVVRGARGRYTQTGIDKRPVEGPVETGHDQLVGDTIVHSYHGGPDQAAYAYAGEDAAWWARELDRPAPSGAFGENFTTDGLDVTNAVIGEVWQIGSARFEVSCPRIPCQVFAAFWDVRDLVKRFTRAGRPGAYLRIHGPGRLAAGDEISLISRPDHGVTIGETFRALTGDHSLAARLLEAPQLPATAHETARQWLATAAPTD